jgi:NTE family protein
MWGIGSELGTATPAYSDALVAERIARVRTDLDRFTDAEQRILENHGYCVAEQRVREKAAHLLPPDPPAAAPPHPEWMDENKARRALRNSHKRMELRRLWGNG